MHDAKKLADYIAKNLPSSAPLPRVILRDLSLRMAPLDVYEPWLTVANDLAPILDCAVLTVAHTREQPDVKTLPADHVWHVATYHDKVRQSDLNIRLTCQRPAVDLALLLQGTEHGRTIIFDAAEAPNVAAQ